MGRGLFALKSTLSVDVDVGRGHGDLFALTQAFFCGCGACWAWPFCTFSVGMTFLHLKVHFSVSVTFLHLKVHFLWA